ncbi:hypothetical protein BV898_18148 [Hypsibius exemplaris]|uniref:Nuclear receptor domain-containing protein n=1 Tax=Hypsibius exemplaris TaxID=2072580 RepID=A0A9X6NNJ1_HYPEX|nr:hypothetical protein BV898_18148 [Hypsibius exemplaris]
MKCGVCGRKASGVNYGALTCEGCKAFYRRVYENSLVYKCKFDSNCDLTGQSTKSCCRACRYKKCLNIGMKISYKSRSKSVKAVQCEQSIQTECQEAKYSVDEQLVTSSTDVQTSRLSCGQCGVIRSSKSVEEPEGLSSFLLRKAELLDSNAHRQWSTIQAVERAVDVVFGGRLDWTSESTLRSKMSSPEQPRSFLGSIWADCHPEGCPRRNRKFAGMLPGTDGLDTSVKRTLTGDWKWITFWMMRNTDRVVCTLGLVRPEEIIQSQINAFIFKFCEQLQGIGLTQTEKGLLLAVALFEPGLPSTVNETELKSQRMLNLMHRHYLEVLIETLKQRCSDREELFSIFRKLERFFTALKDVCEVYRRYTSGTLEGSQKQMVPHEGQVIEGQCSLLQS